MFIAGITPAKAFQTFTEELRKRHGDDLHIIEAHKSHNPDIKMVSNMYYICLENNMVKQADMV